MLHLLGHVGEGVSEVLLAEGQLADGPDLGVLEVGDTTVSLEVPWHRGGSNWRNR